MDYDFTSLLRPNDLVLITFNTRFNDVIKTSYAIFLGRCHSWSSANVYKFRHRHSFYDFQTPGNMEASILLTNVGRNIWITDHIMETHMFSDRFVIIKNIRLQQLVKHINKIKQAWISYRRRSLEEILAKTILSLDVCHLIVSKI